jgi:hypothetical protein
MVLGILYRDKYALTNLFSIKMEQDLLGVGRNPLVKKSINA